MKIFSQEPILLLTGEQLENPHTQEKVTFRMIAISACVSKMQGDPPDGGRFGFDMFRLAMRIADNDWVTLSSDEIVTLKRRIADQQGSYLVVGRCFEIMEGKRFMREYPAQQATVN